MHGSSPAAQAPGYGSAATRHARALVVALALAVAAAGCNRIETRVRAPEGAPNVLLVSIDTLRADRVGAYGSTAGATPHLDALAREGTRFATAIAPAPLTLPSHATLFTGLLPPRHGVRHNGLFRLAPEIPTLAERLHEAGWATGAFVGSVVLGPGHGLERGFERYDAEMGREQSSLTGYPERGADAVARAARAWLRETRAPFFAFVHFYDPHADYRPPAPFRERFAAQPYEGEIAHADAALGTLLDALREQGRLEDTVVVVTSDHGESLGEHGERTHGYGLYDATLAVPLLWRGPGVPRGRVDEGVVSLASVAPTLVALLGLAPLGDGDDLSARWRGAELAAGVAYAESLATRLDHGWSPLHALRTDTHLYVRAPRPELYDVRSDPHQLRDLAARGDAAPVLASLDEALAGALRDERPLALQPLDEATRAQLAALGYAVAAAPARETGLDPKDGLPLVESYVEARAALARGDLAAADRLVRAVLEASPESPKAHALLAAVLETAGRGEEALAHARRAAELLPASGAYQAQLGDFLWRRGDAGGALLAYRRAVDADAGDAGVRLRLATALDRERDAAGALEQYEAALHLRPGWEEAHLGIAVQLARLGRGDEVSRHVEAAGATAREAEGRNRLAIAFAGAGDAERAEALFRAILAEDPGHPNAARNLAHLLRQTGRDREADALLGTDG